MAKRFTVTITRNDPRQSPLEMGKTVVVTAQIDLINVLRELGIGDKATVKRVL